MTKRNLFKVLDPILKRDTYLYLGALWIMWTLAQVVFLLIMEGTVELNAVATGGRNLILGFLGLSAFLMLFSILMVNSLLNRITGPIHRLKLELEEARREGRPPVVKLRQDDYFQDLAELINATTRGPQ